MHTLIFHSHSIDIVYVQKKYMSVYTRHAVAEVVTYGNENFPLTRSRPQMFTDLCQQHSYIGFSVITM